MSRDCPEGSNNKNGPQPNEDLYAWSGEPGQGNGHCHDGSAGGGGNGQGGNPDLYQWAGQGSGPAAGSDAGGGGTDNSGPPNGWHPDYSYSSPLAKEWLKANEQTRGDALKMNPDGTYTVQFGDCLSTIAQRALQDQGDAKPTGTDITSEENKIVKANDTQYSSLDTDKDFIRTGWKLAIPGETNDQSGGQGTGQADVPPHHQCVPHPEGNRPDVPPPAGYDARPSVIVNNIYVKGNAFFNEGGGYGGQQGPGQLGPQHRFHCQGGPGGQGGQPENYYSNNSNNGYNPSMQYNWQPNSSGNGSGPTTGYYGNWGPSGGQSGYNGNWNSSGPSNGQTGNGNWNSSGSSYAGSGYYNNYSGNGDGSGSNYAGAGYYNNNSGNGDGSGSNYAGAGYYNAQPIPNAYPGEGQAVPIPNATGPYNAELINYEGSPNQGGPQTYPAEYTVNNNEGTQPNTNSPPPPQPLA